MKVEEGICCKRGGCNAGGTKGCSGREQNGSGSKGQPTPITQALAFSMCCLSPPALAHMT